MASSYVAGQDQSAYIKEAPQKERSINLASQIDASKVSIDRHRTRVILTLEYQTLFPLVGAMQDVWNFGPVKVDGR